ncbi:MAG: HDIG domain-containing metalloprotein [Desulfonatronovibrionaceae bacterium]
MLTRQKAISLLYTELGEETALINHSLETEAVMRALAGKLGSDPELWGITGLVHDIDYSRTKSTPERHALEGAEMLAGRLPEEALRAIKAHNSEYTGVDPETDFDFALRAGETVTGLISASALVRPQKMEGMKPKGLKKKMKDKAFAASVSRERIHECSRIGLELTDFLALSIAAVSGIAGEVGLD